MKKILVFNPAISSSNLGDHIIAESVYKQASEILNKSFIVDVSTHLPLSSYMKRMIDFDYKFVAGSNLLRGKMNKLFRQWDIKMRDAKYLRNSILIGVGWWQYNDNPNNYTKKLYNKILDPKHLHSVRDSYSEKQLRSIGINNVINTSCPTMWDLTPKHCEQIPKEKKSNVVCTITDYMKAVGNDKKMFEILLDNYKKVYFWAQGSQDFEYFNRLGLNSDRIIIVPPTLDDYVKVLESKDMEYVGTRLHAGIKALQMKKRSIIIGIDNRAKEKHRDFNIKVLDRKNIDDLDSLINSSFTTDIKIPTDNIDKWLSQFK